MQRSLDSRFPRSARRKQRAEVQSELELANWDQQLRLVSLALRGSENRGARRVVALTLQTARALLVIRLQVSYCLLDFDDIVLTRSLRTDLACRLQCVLIHVQRFGAPAHPA